MKKLFYAGALIVLLFISSCAKPPINESKLAQQAFKRAAIAKDCDRENYLIAEELLEKARLELKKENYEKAKELFAKVIKRSDAIAEYYRTHLEKCLPKEEEEITIVEKTEEEPVPPAQKPEIALPVIHFEFNIHKIRAEDKILIRNVAEWMHVVKEQSIQIEGHADERGSIDFNMSLGEKRAMEVLKELMMHGVDQSRVEIISYGEEKPADSSSGEKSWYKNRRSEFRKLN